MSSKPQVKKRILVCVTRAELGGVQTHIATLMRHLQGIYDFLLVTGEEGYLCEYSRKLGIKVILLHELVRNISPIADVLALHKLRKIIADEKPHLIHAHSSKAGFLARLVGKQAGVPVVYTAHGWGFSSGIPFWRRMLVKHIERFASRFTKHIICVSQADYRLARAERIGRADNISVVHNGVSEESDKAPASMVIHQRIADKLNLTMVARFTTQKDHHTLLNAVSLLKFPFQLDLIGDGPTMPRIRELGDSLGVNDRVCYLGATHAVNEVLSRTDVFILLSLWEGLPVSIIEAMRARLPVVATDVGGVGELVDPNVTGFLARPGSSSEVAEYLKQLWENPKLRVRCGEAGKIKYDKYFTAERMAELTRRIYDLCLLVN